MFRIHRDRRFCHRLSACESALRNRRHRALHVLVHVRDVRDIRCIVNDGRVIDIGNLGDVHRGITDVDAIHVGFTDVIRRHIHFPWAQREPAHIAAKSARSASDEHHQRGRIDGMNCHWPGDPAPSSANAHPPSVMERGVAPRSVIHPGVSPRIDPGPMAIVVRSPPHCNVRIPDVSIIAFVAPVAVVVEIVIADHVGRDVVSGT